LFQNLKYRNFSKTSEEKTCTLLPARSRFEATSYLHSSCYRAGPDNHTDQLLPDGDGGTERQKEPANHQKDLSF